MGEPRAKENPESRDQGELVRLGEEEANRHVYAVRLAGPSDAHLSACRGKGEMMFQKFITAIIVVVAICVAASGLPLASMFGAGSGILGFFKLPLVF